MLNNSYLVYFIFLCLCQRHINFLLLLFFFFIFRDEIFCPLAVMNHSYSCVCKLTNESILSTAEYTIKLCNESGCCPVTEQFDPTLNSKYELIIVHTNGMCPSDFHVCWCFCVFTCMSADMSACYCIHKMTLNFEKLYFQSTVPVLFRRST